MHAPVRPQPAALPIGVPASWRRLFRVYRWPPHLKVSLFLA